MCAQGGAAWTVPGFLWVLACLSALSQWLQEGGGRETHPKVGEGQAQERRDGSRRCVGEVWSRRMQDQLAWDRC